MALHRAQILLEEEQHRELERRANEAGRSMSDLVREAVDDYLTRTAEAEAISRSLAAIVQLSELRGTIRSRAGALKTSLLDRLREERDTELAP